MKGRFKSPGKILSGGHSAKLSGPIESWDSDEASAVFEVVLTQNGVRASGTSEVTYAPARKWTATVEASSGSLVAGVEAEAVADAYITNTDGTQEPKPYEWGQAIDLVR